MNAVVEHQPLWLEQVSARWREVLDDKNLHDLPYKIETNRQGQVVMSPARNVHGAHQSLLAQLLRERLGGRTITECSVATPEGVKVADVAWCSNDFFQRYGYEDPYAVAPEICVEIKSPSNAEAELLAKVRLYLDAGAIEVWLIDAKAVVRVYGRGGALAASSFGIDTSTIAFDSPKA